MSMVVIAVHGGAGHFPSSLDQLVKTGLKRACVRALAAETNSASLAVVDAIVELENDETFNAGHGSNLTEEGLVECDAALMNSAGEFGSVGAVKGIRNPIRLAHLLLSKSRQNRHNHLGRVSPLTLVASGAELFAAESGHCDTSVSSLIVSPQSLISSRASEEHAYWLARASQIGELEPQTDDLYHTSTWTGVQDTVGAVVMDDNEDFAAGVSSGGILLKHPGRLGEAAVFGAGCWAQRCVNSMSMACSVSGTGEDIIKAALSRALGEQLGTTGVDPHEVLARVLNNFCRQSEEAHAGILLLTKDQGDNVRLWCGFTTSAMAVACASSANKVKAWILRQDLQSKELRRSVCITALAV